ncbi:MAG: DsrE/DsrF/TusD sulfur relay family protein [Acidimicrobiales bacterium]
MKVLMILNDPPYGTERVYNGLRLAMNLQAKHEEIELLVFLLGDAASSAKSGQKTPNGYYNVERMLASVSRKGATVLVCGTCMDARGLTDPELVDGATRSTMDELTELTVAADKVLVF